MEMYSSKSRNYFHYIQSFPFSAILIQFKCILVPLTSILTVDYRISTLPKRYFQKEHNTYFNTDLFCLSKLYLLKNKIKSSMKICFYQAVHEFLQGIVQNGSLFIDKRVEKNLLAKEEIRDCFRKVTLL